MTDACDFCGGHCLLNANVPASFDPDYDRTETEISTMAVLVHGVTESNDPKETP